jgi:hypothetical protein
VAAKLCEIERMWLPKRGNAGKPRASLKVPVRTDRRLATGVTPRHSIALKWGALMYHSRGELAMRKL